MNNNALGTSRRFLLAGIIVAILFAAIVLLNRSKPAAKPAAATSFTVVSAVVAERKSVAQQMVFSGPLVGREEVLVYADLRQGKITDVLVELGQGIKAGETLATIDTKLLKIQESEQQAARQRAQAAVSQQESMLEEAQVQYAQARLERQRGDDVSKSGLISQEVSEQRIAAEKIAEKRVQAANASLKMAQADLAMSNSQAAQTDLQLGHANIRAPVSGTVIERNAHAGLSLEQNSEPLFILLKDDTLEVELEIPAADVGYIKTGMPVTIQMLGDAASYSGKIRYAPASIHRAEQVAKVRVRFDKAPKGIPGQFARVTVTMHSKDGIYLPDSAFLFDGAIASIFTIHDGKAIRVPVKLGERVNGMIEVTAGIPAGMPVIDSFAPFIHEGDLIKAVVGEAAAVARDQNRP